MFDLEKGSTLYIDLAKSNSRSEHTRISLLLIGIILFDLSLLVFYCLAGWKFNYVDWLIMTIK